MLKLPTIKICTFGGVYQEWPVFWDMNASLVHHRTDISDVMKLSILRGSLAGNTVKVVKGSVTHGDRQTTNVKQRW